MKIRRALAEAAPDAYLPGLATSLYISALLQAQDDRLQDASVVAQEAISSYRVLAATEPEAFLANLRDALKLALEIIDQLDRSEERESVRRELKAVERRLTS